MPVQEADLERLKQRNEGKKSCGNDPEREGEMGNPSSLERGRIKAITKYGLNEGRGNSSGKIEGRKGGRKTWSQFLRANSHHIRCFSTKKARNNPAHTQEKTDKKKDPEKERTVAVE